MPWLLLMFLSKRVSQPSGSTCLPMYGLCVEGLWVGSDMDGFLYVVPSPILSCSITFTLYQSMTWFEVAA